MPIYVYRCENCGSEKELLQKMSDAPLTHCDACDQDTMVKQVTAAGFELKGTGWYVMVVSPHQAVVLPRVKQLQSPFNKF